ncbi:MAG TPA: phosphoribosylanthranilate isomerase [Polyangiaceae bacterium]|nr:phosphoribosylanthranilate isomerase [Polyangiaceae bacterium]
MYVKVCGITQLDDALEAVRAGADALGFNCVPSSKRYLAPEQIRAITERLHGEGAGKTICVAVVADVGRERAASLLDELGVERLQLHGDESEAELLALGPRAFKALRVGDAADVARALAFPGHPLLVDAKVEGQLGGTGHTLDWGLIEPLARARPLILAGGLTPENVADAVARVRPWGVDVASGVETPGNPRRKDPDRMRRFVAAARSAAPSNPGPSF